MVAVLAGTLVVSAAPARAAEPCPAGFRCAGLDVPLDRSGAVPGVVHLRYAAQRSYPRGAGLLIALTGGPGQPGVALAGDLAASLAPALRRYRVVVLDQRGTGESGALVCPEVQALRALDPIRPAAVAACAARVGPARAFYSTADTVLDLDALRARLGAEKVALMGVSYGTYVSLQYARAFPAHVDRLILDSIVGPGDPDPYELDTFQALPRILREQCARDRCRQTTPDPLADVAALVDRLRSGPLRGTALDATGRRRPVVYRSGEELAALIIAGDLNFLLRPFVPAAISSAVRGDPAMLMRLRRVAQGTATPVRDLSFGLNVTTVCADARLPYSLLTPPAARPALLDAALAGVPSSSYAPFDLTTVRSIAPAEDCLQWPQDATRPAFTGPLPDVPALLLSGRLDTRTPLENARATAARLPHAALVGVAGLGHSVLGSDFTGCSTTALRRFIAGQPAGRPCAGESFLLPPLPLPPRSLSDFRAAPGVGGRRGRAVFATLETLQEAELAALQAALGGLPPRGGGLRAGSYALDLGRETLRLRGYAYVPGVRLTGTLRTDKVFPRGRITVRGPEGTSGTLVLDSRGGARGRLGGRPVRYRGSSGQAAAAAGGHALRADGPSLPRLGPRLARLAARRAALR